MSHKQNLPFPTLIALTVSLLLGCDGNNIVLPQEGDADANGATPATAFTVAHNAKVLEELPFGNREDFDLARRGLIASPDSLRIAGPDGDLAWNMDSYSFIRGDAPPTVNPSLWRQAELNNIHGLFEVVEGIYQLRGFDLANMSLIRGEGGWIVVDPLTNAQTAEAAMRFAFEHLTKAPITAVLFTHSHIDHFGGVLGALRAADTPPEAVRVIAPPAFLDEATSENILAGATMLRRSEYMYGMPLPRTERGHVGSGLGKEPSSGDVGILPPTDTIADTGQGLTIDGVEFVFQNVSGSEAPSEFTFYLPRFKAFCGAEMLSRNLHNLYTLRGAKVRDALAWSGFIDEARTLFGEAEVYFASHHWPLWGRDRIQAFLEIQRDSYKFIHDQTLRYAYQGYTPEEIAERIELPVVLRQGFSNRGYYGTVSHNVRAVYQFYFGWYDGNPANLNPLPPEEEALRYVDAMGGADAVLSKAREAFDRGDYRWVGTLLNHLVFAQPDNVEARALLARNYDQLGYQAESGPWRDVYLTGAQELRRGAGASVIQRERMRNLVRYTERSNFFDVMAAQLNAEKAEGVEMVLNFNFTDLEENHVFTLKNSVLHHREAPLHPNANATLNITHDLFLNLVLGTATLKDFALSDDVSIDGNRLDLARFFTMQDKAEGGFGIVLP